MACVGALRACGAPAALTLGVRFQMNHLVRTILGPFASAATGAIMAILFGLFVGVRDESFLNGLALVGAVCALAPTVAPLVVAMVGLYRSERERTKNHKRVEQAQSPAAQQESESAGIVARQAMLLAEHEARRPVCAHCDKKTKAIFRHLRADGGADRRYRNNTALCNQCFEPYAPVRPWSLNNSDESQ